MSSVRKSCLVKIYVRKGILKEFWNELEFLRTTAFYIYSCFADKVSCSFLNDTNDNHSQVARRV